MEPKKVTRDEYIRTLYARMPEILKIDPRVNITLGDGKVYTLLYDNQAALDILKDTEQSGQTFNLITDPIQGKHLSNPGFLGCLLHRGLQRNHPEIDLRTVNALVNIRYLRYVVDRVVEATVAIFPDTSDLMIEKKEDPAEGSREDNPT